MLQAALNGPLTKADHPATPVTAQELANDAAACAAAGAGAIHMHPRDRDGRESLAADVVDPAVRAAREAAGIPVGVSTGAWIEPDLERRLALLREWREPDYASVNVSEEGASDVMRVLTENGIGIEAGVWSADDAERLAAIGLPVLRVLVEPLGEAGGPLVPAIHEALDRLGIDAPRLQHGDGPATWPLLRDAFARGLDSRIGFEDTLLLPDGAPAGSNADLVRAARRYSPPTLSGP